MRKRFLKFISIVIASTMFMSFFLFAKADNGEDRNFTYFLTAKDYFQKYYDIEEWFVETVDGVKYAYIVENGEATIINVQTNYWGPDEMTLVFPTNLGGYPVTAIGYDRIEVFLFLSYTDSIYPEDYDDSKESIGRIEYDPGHQYVTEVIIPEGYKYIRENGLTWWGDRKWVLPKSLRQIQGHAFEQLYTHVDDNNVKYTVLPECEYMPTNSVPFVGMQVYSPIYFPSRVTSETSAEMLIRKLSYGDIYLPSNFSSSVIRDTLFVYAPNPEDPDGDRIWQGDEDVNNNYGKNTTIHCSPDSDFLKVFREINYRNYYTIITDVIPAEYIEFPEETVNIHVGDVVDLEAKTYPADAIWTACDYEVSDPSVVKIDEYSGRITALKEGTVTVTATHCERGFVDTCTVNVVPEPVPGVNEIKPATDTPYYSYGNRDYTLDVTGSPSKIQVVRDNGGTTTIDRRRAKVTSNGETETWVVNMRVEAGTHNIRAKYGNKWEERLTPFTVTYDIPPTPKAYSFDLGYENGLGTFEVITDPQIIKVQFLLDNGCTLTYSQSYSYVAEDGLRHWAITRKIPANTNYTLKTKLGYTWTTTDLTVTS